MRGAALPFCALPAPRDTAVRAWGAVRVCVRGTRAQGRCHIDVQGAGGKLYRAIKPSRVPTKGPAVIYPRSAPRSSTGERGRPPTCTGGARLRRWGGGGGGWGRGSHGDGAEGRGDTTRRAPLPQWAPWGGSPGASPCPLPSLLVPPLPTAAPPCRSFAGHRSSAAAAPRPLCVGFPAAEIGPGGKLGRAPEDPPPRQRPPLG